MAPRVEVIEIVWTCLLLVALLYGIRAHYRAVQTRAYVLARGMDSAIEVVSKGNERRQFIRLVWLSALLVVGVIALFTTPGTVRPRYDPIRTATVALFLLFAFLVVLESHLDERDSRKLVELEEGKMEEHQ